VDWNNHVGAQHHIDGAQFGDIRYTEPFLNNQHIVEPTLFYLENLAKRSGGRRGRNGATSKGICCSGRRHQNLASRTDLRYS